jgi:hypothetical protein
MVLEPSVAASLLRQSAARPCCSVCLPPAEGAGCIVRVCVSCRVRGGGAALRAACGSPRSAASWRVVGTVRTVL